MEARQWLVILLAIGIGLFQPGALLAAEHGGTTLSGKEHGGQPVGQEHGGTPITTQQVGPDANVWAPGSAEMLVSGEVAILRRAADALRRGEVSPDLADQLDQLAEQHVSH